MKFFKKSKRKEQRQAKEQIAKNVEMRRAMYSVEKTVGNRNPMSRGQGYSGESKVAILQMMQDND